MPKTIQTQIVEEVNKGEFESVKNYTSQIEVLLDDDAKLEVEEKGKVLTLCYKQVNFLTRGKFLEHLAQISSQKIVKKQPVWATKTLNYILQPIK